MASAPSESTLALGIDFGTSDTVAAVRRADGRLTTLLFEGSPLLPSAVAIAGDGTLIAGRDARRGRHRSPESIEPYPKRAIDAETVRLGGREVPVVELIAAVLRRVHEECVRVAGDPDRIAVTFPATWGPVRRRTLADAARAAGLGPVALIPEPVAAAAYFVAALRRRVPIGSALVVYDLGAGDFGASVVSRTADGFATLAVDGQDHLGGLDFDRAIVDLLGRRYSGEPDWRRLVAPSTAAERRYRRELFEEVRSAREALSHGENADVTLPLLGIETRLTRDEIEAVCGPLLRRTVTATQGVLREAGLTPEQIAGVFLVGGASRTPLAAMLLREVLGIEPTTTDEPELVVAEGSLRVAKEKANRAPPKPRWVPPQSGSPVKANRRPVKPGWVPPKSGAGPVPALPPVPAAAEELVEAATPVAVSASTGDASAGGSPPSRPADPTGSTPPSPPPPSPSPSEPPHSTGRSRRRRALAATAGAATLVLIAAAAFVIQYLNAPDRGTTDAEGDGTAATATAVNAEATWAIGGGWSHWSPWRVTESRNLYQVLAPMLATLGVYGPDGAWRHNDAVLDGPPELVGEDPMRVSYKLNPDANWGDGTPIGVDDFVYAWHHASGRDDHCGPCYTDEGYAAIASIEGTSNGHILIEYEAGHITPEWDRQIEMLRFPVHKAVEAGFTDWRDDPETMGDSVAWFADQLPDWSAGPFIITDAAVGEFVVYEPNPAYAGSVEPGLSKLTLKVVDGEAERVAMLRSGELDGTTMEWHPIQDDYTGSLGARELTADIADGTVPDLAFEVYEGRFWFHFSFNLRHPTLADQRLREAIFTALDVRSLIEGIHPGAETERTTNFLFRRNSQYFVDLFAESDQGTGAVAAARTLLEDAGYELKHGVLLDPQGEPVTFNLRFDEADWQRAEVAERARIQLEALGIEVEIEPAAHFKAQAMLVDADYDMALFGGDHSPRFPSEACRNWCSDSELNFGALQDANLDEAIRLVDDTMNLDQAAAAANEAAALVVEHAYMLPIATQPEWLFHSTLLQGLQGNPSSRFGPLWNVREWRAA